LSWSTFLSLVRERFVGPAKTTMMVDTTSDTIMNAMTPAK
jgi:hypothetical protein